MNIEIQYDDDNENENTTGPVTVLTVSALRVL